MIAHLRPTIPLFIAGLFLLYRPAAAQELPADVPLEDFVDQVAELWTQADVPALVELLPAEDLLLLDAGSGTESANPRHAAAALRALFAQHETIAATPVRTAVSSTSPKRGFGELAWIYRLRGVPAEQSRQIYLAAMQQERGWTITELRLLP